MASIHKFLKLKKQLESLFVPELKLEFNCDFSTNNKVKGKIQVDNFVLKLGRYSLWQFPRYIRIKGFHKPTWSVNNCIQELMQEYLDLPVNKILDHTFMYDDIILSTDEREFEIRYHLASLFIAADKRIGKEKLLNWSEKMNDNEAHLILEKRFPDMMHDDRLMKWVKASRKS